MDDRTRTDGKEGRMDVIYGWDAGIKENTLTLHYTESEIIEIMLSTDLVHKKVLKPFQFFYLHLTEADKDGKIVSSPDGENGEVMIRRNNG